MASRNQSNKETTVKTTLRTMTSDAWTIDNLLLFCNYKKVGMMPEGLILDDYRDYFEQFLIEVKVSEEYYYTPSLFSEIQYGTPDLDFLILYFAKIPSLFEFNQPKIKMLPVTMLSDLNKLIVQNKNLVKQSKANPKDFPELEAIKIPKKGYL